MIERSEQGEELLRRRLDVFVDFENVGERPISVPSDAPLAFEWQCVGDSKAVRRVSVRDGWVRSRPTSAFAMAPAVGLGSSTGPTSRPIGPRMDVGTEATPLVAIRSARSRGVDVASPATKSARPPVRRPPGRTAGRRLRRLTERAAAIPSDTLDSPDTLGDERSDCQIKYRLLQLTLLTTCRKMGIEPRRYLRETLAKILSGERDPVALSPETFARKLAAEKATATAHAA